ncbi:hypothetical protein M899_3060 [Bacteriovorax sp. BSW11_IV]|uniref:hypothetical protein n=1 Tax=Bacteriovorax sp. BSW11_IV TaxID=1353529 RepID=UPI000389E6B2|nr:hypothetical protein [Bacteriovorax sp. BSW11_IV]EQC49531.1 hypothetical protein M899_3060 [Bacteriovorax sp. BSW11_IV]
MANSLKKFCKDYIGTNILRIKNYIEQSKSSNTVTIQIPINNLFLSLINNAYIEGELTKEILNENKTEISKLIMAASKARVDLKNESYGSKWHIRSGSNDLIDNLLYNLEFFDEHGFSNIIKEGLVTLRDDIIKNPSDYPQALRQKVQKLYSMGE